MSSWLFIWVNVSHEQETACFERDFEKSPSAPWVLLWVAVILVVKGKLQGSAAFCLCLQIHLDEHQECSLLRGIGESMLNQLLEHKTWDLDINKFWHESTLVFLISIRSSLFGIQLPQLLAVLSLAAGWQPPWNWVIKNKWTLGLDPLGVWLSEARHKWKLSCLGFALLHVLCYIGL